MSLDILRGRWARWLAHIRLWLTPRLAPEPVRVRVAPPAHATRAIVVSRRRARALGARADRG